jgi:hypothetical protein
MLLCGSTYAVCGVHSSAAARLWHQLLRDVAAERKVLAAAAEKQAVDGFK